MSAFRQSSFPQPPVAATKPHTVTAHGESWDDPYAWLRDPAYPKVADAEILAYLKAENDYAEAVQSAAPDARPGLFDEMKARIVEDDAQAPYRYRGSYYYWRFEKGAQHRIHCRRASPDEPEEILLDVNHAAALHSFYQVSTVRVSPDETLLAYAEDTDGSERYTLRLKHLRTGDILAEHVDHAAPSIVWSLDSLSFFYCRLDEQLRPRQVFRHVIGDDPRHDRLIYKESDPTFWLSIGRSLSERFLFIMAAAKTSTEVRYVPLDRPDAAPVMIAPRRPDHEYYVTDRGDSFYIRTNDTRRNYRIVETLIRAPEEAKWRELVAPSDDRYLISLIVTHDWWAVFERVEGLTSVRVFDDGGDHLVSFPDVAYAVDVGAMAEYRSGALRLAYESPVTPPATYDYHVAERRLETLKATIVPTYDPSLFTVERRWAVARDGTKVPVTLIARRDLKRDGAAPLLLYGYGAYGYGIEPGFSAQRFSLIERGFVWAIAHIRGGDELGARWYEDGKLLKKQNSFSDFIDVAGFLAEERYTSRGRIAAMGGSAGGLLVGAAMNQAPPGLFHVVMAIVPFVDALNTMLDASLPLTPPEYHEWGNPADQAIFQAMKSYSPYDNVSARAYPHVYASAGLSDPRVTYWEPAKWVAKLRALKTDDSVVVLKTNMAAGHGGASGRYERLEEVAGEFAFLLKAFDLADSVPARKASVWRDQR
jgi:oligopeptidase B